MVAVAGVFLKLAGLITVLDFALSTLPVILLAHWPVSGRQSFDTMIWYHLGWLGIWAEMLPKDYQVPGASGKAKILCIEPWRVQTSHASGKGPSVVHYSKIKCFLCFVDTILNLQIKKKNLYSCT